jgi:hypothetical protein
LSYVDENKHILFTNLLDINGEILLSAVISAKDFLPHFCCVKEEKKMSAKF